jgi:5-oxoprolinase (ATP-hydrolysing)
VDPGNFGIPLNFAAAEGALREIRDKLAGTGSQTDERLLSGFLQIANERMAGAIRQISVLKGYDPSEYTLLAFGGAGGQHACQVAELLKMTSVLIPPDAGLLSAYGMGQAVIERFSTRQVLRPLDEVEGQLNQMLNDLTLQAQDALSAEGFPPEETQVGRQSLFLRFKGQDASIEIPFSPGTAPAEAFRWQYEALYGHWIGNRELELESAKVIITTRPALQTLPEKKGRDYSPVPYNTQRCFTAGEWQQTPVFRWQDLKPGAVIAGPALIVSPTSTTLAEPGWTFRTDAAGNGVMVRTKNQEETEPAELSDATEAVQLALFTNRFTAIAAEMGALLERTAFSVNVKERLDFSCAVLDTDGYLVVNAPHIPVHLGSLGICVRSVMAALPLEDGDVAITNHPGFGGSHLPDITLISPVHDEAGRRIGFVANRAHHAEIGGKRPGSMPPDARNLAEEGIVISPTWLVRRGEARWEEITSQLTTAHYPSRALAENLADLQAALAAIRSGKTALQNLCRAYGARRVGHYMQELKKYAATSLLRRIGSMPRGDYPAEELLDDGSKIKVQVTVSPSRLRISFAGTSGTHPRNLNATPAIVNSAVMYVLRLLVDEDIPLNEGLMEAVDLHLPEGLLNPGFPEDPQKCPAVVGGNTETSQRVVDTLLKALGLAACSQGTMNNVVFGNATFGYYETIGGGTGAGHGFNGASAVHQHMTNTRITDPEVMEFRYPVRLEQFAVRKDSGGAGQWKGGDGIIRELRFLEPVSLTVLAEHRWTAPYGLSGGEPGQPGRQYIIRKDGATQELSGSAGAEMTPGDRFVIETPGGGGFGCE